MYDKNAVNAVKKLILVALETQGTIEVTHGEMKGVNVKESFGITGYHETEVCIALRDLVSSKSVHQTDTGKRAKTRMKSTAHDEAAIFAYALAT